MRLRQATSSALLAALIASARPVGGQTVTFERTVEDLRSDDPAMRLKAVRALELAGYEEAAVPLAALVSDPQGTIRLEAIRAELNLFLVGKVVPRRRIGVIVEMRSSVSAESAFAAGDDALEAADVPSEVLTALRAAMHDQNGQVALEALDAFGTLAATANRTARADVLQSAAPDLAGMLGVDSAEMRRGALRVIGRLFEWRQGDPPPDQALGDGLVASLNERQTGLRIAAMDALGAMRYDRAVEALTDLFTRYERGPEAASALRALARIAHPSTEPMFVASLTSRDSAVKAAAVEGVARLGDEATLTAVSSAVASDHADAVALAGEFAKVRLANGPIDLLVEALGRSRTRDTALRYLAETGQSHASAIAAYAESRDPGIRAAIADVLGRSGEADPQTTALLQRLEQDAEPAVARAAVRALGRLGPASHRMP
jgi:HEAT repeat protein